MAEPIKPTVSVNNEVAELQAKLLRTQLEKEELELHELKERRATSDESLRSNQAARKQGAKVMQDLRNAELKRQEQCPHRKPNNQTVLAGQYDHQGHLILNCLYCAADFNEVTCPPFLLPPMDRVGGPQRGAF